jgi:hypothetical protein
VRDQGYRDRHRFWRVREDVEESVWWEVVHEHKPVLAIFMSYKRIRVPSVNMLTIRKIRDVKETSDPDEVVEGSPVKFSLPVSGSQEAEREMVNLLSQTFTHPRTRLTRPIEVNQESRVEHQKPEVDD